MKYKSILLYDDIQGLGHIPFFQFVCQQMLNIGEVMVILGSDISPELFKGSQTVLITPRSKSNNDIEKARIMKIRKTEIRSIIHDFQPNIFFIDYFPFGKFGNTSDIETIISYIHLHGGKNITFMRDIYLGKKLLKNESYHRLTSKIKKQFGAPISTIIQHTPGVIHQIVLKSKLHRVYLAQIFLEYYISQGLIDGVIVFGDSNIFDIREEFILDNFSKRVFHHVGYIPPYSNSKNNTKAVENTQKRKKILVSSGGGITSESDFIALMSALSFHKDFDIHILIGPYVTKEIRKKVEEFTVHSHITVGDFVDNFNKLLSDSDIFFGYGGYGTFQSLFHYSGKAYIMSNYNLTDFLDRYYEQKYRTLLFRHRLNIEYLSDFSKKNIRMCLDNIDIIDIIPPSFCTQKTFLDTLGKIVGK